jgi:hypothetical protein
MYKNNNDVLFIETSQGQWYGAGDFNHTRPFGSTIKGYCITMVNPDITKYILLGNFEMPLDKFDKIYFEAESKYYKKVMELIFTVQIINERK